ncbi:MAG: AAA family ATPase [Alphaproteobacteria bacterium]|nr:AAA family ATPase [Alphaproteobacteria bacterium]
MSDARNLMELKEEAIRARYDGAMALLGGFDHAPRIAKADIGPKPERSSGIGVRRRPFRSTTPGLVTKPSARPQGVHLIDTIKAADDGDPLTSPLQATVLQSLRRALAVANVVGDLYADQIGLEKLKRDNLVGRLSGELSVKFAEMLAANALVSLFVFANMANFLLAPSVAEAGDNIDIGEVREILTDNPGLALEGALWELDQAIEKQAQTENDVIAVIKSYSEKLMEKVARRGDAAPRLEAFRAASYRVEADGFEVSGFAPAHKAQSSKLSMTFKKPTEVVGNHIAKYQAMKLSKMLMAYDFERRLNPFAELGGFIFTFMGDGMPGTGKTTLIQMMAGLISGYCEVAGYAFRYQNLGTDSIDSYQGKSAQNAKAFINNVLDPGVIGFGTIDDIDQLAGNRGDRQSSAGQLEITAVLMESFAGANTVIRGNCTFGMFSNYPENVDDALRQRAGARFLVDGPKTQADYVDILYLLMGDNHNIDVGAHDLFAAQEIKRAVAASFAGHGRPQEQALANVFDRVASQLGALDTIAKMGAYLKAIQEADARFTGRAIKNITDAVKVRAMDVELPDEWMEKPELFLFKDYETKTAMLKGLMQPITTDMLLQEINRYADSEFRYADKSDEAAIEAAVRDMGRMDAAKRRYLGREGT